MSEITYSELMTELNKFPNKQKGTNYTKEQLEFVDKAKEKGLSWKKIVELWNTVGGWEKINCYRTLSGNYNYYKQSLLTNLPLSND